MDTINGICNLSSRQTIEIIIITDKHYPCFARHFSNNCVQTSDDNRIKILVTQRLSLLDRKNSADGHAPARNNFCLLNHATEKSLPLCKVIRRQGSPRRVIDTDGDNHRFNARPSRNA